MYVPPNEPWQPLTATPDENWLLNQWALVDSERTIQEACQWPYCQFGIKYYFQRTDIDGSAVDCEVDLGPKTMPCDQAAI